MMIFIKFIVIEKVPVSYKGITFFLSAGHAGTVVLASGFNLSYYF